MAEMTTYIRMGLMSGLRSDSVVMKEILDLKVHIVDVMTQLKVLEDRVELLWADYENRHGAVGPHAEMIDPQDE